MTSTHKANKESNMSDVCNHVTINGHDYERVREQHPDIVIVRTQSAGVHVGTIKERDGQEVTLLNARRIWRWRGANTLNEAAVKGIGMDWTRVSDPVQSILLTQAIEIITVSKDAVESLTTSRWPS